MTEKELIQALRWCASNPDCGCIGCPGEENCEGGGKSVLDAAARLEALIAENEHLREDTKMVPQWHPASEPPEELYEKDGCLKNYLIFSPEDGIDIGNYLKEARCWFNFGCPVLITHWAELPVPPSTDEVE